MRPLFNASLVVGPVLLRLAIGCGGTDYDQDKDPRFAPYVKAIARTSTCEAQLDGTWRLQFSVSAELRKRTYNCPSSATYSCWEDDRSNPDEPCHTSGDVFGEAWGDVSLAEDVPVTRVRSSTCDGAGSCMETDIAVADTMVLIVADGTKTSFRVSVGLPNGGEATGEAEVWCPRPPVVPENDAGKEDASGATDAAPLDGSSE